MVALAVFGLSYHIPDTGEPTEPEAAILELEQNTQRPGPTVVFPRMIATQEVVRVLAGDCIEHPNEARTKFIALEGVIDCDSCAEYCVGDTV